MLRILAREPFAFALTLFLALLVANLVVQPRFADPASLPGTLATFAPFALVAMASMPSILSGGGGIDISVGPLAVVVNSVLAVWLLPDPVLGTGWIAVPIVLAIGAAVGGVNGVLVAVLRYQPVIATLCISFVLTGLALKIAPVPQTIPRGTWLDPLVGTAGPIPGALIVLAVPVLIWLVLGATRYRRDLYAVGSNDATAYSAGLPVARIRIGAYVLGGVIAAIAGIALTALVRSSQAGSAASFTLIALAAVALGGTSLAGGRGGLFGVILGAGAIYLIQTLLTSVGVSSTWRQFLYGAVLVGGVVIGALISMPRTSRRRS